MEEKPYDAIAQYLKRREEEKALLARKEENLKKSIALLQELLDKSVDVETLSPTERRNLIKRVK